MTSPVLVGREPELALLRNAYEHSLTAEPVTVLVTGEAGIGKSRLVSTVVRELPGDPVVLSGGCLELGADGAPYVPFVAVLRDLVRQLGRDEVISSLPADGTALGDWLPGLGPPPARFGRTRLLEEVLRLLSGIDRPVVVVVEDLHWADASSRELFAYAPTSSYWSWVVRGRGGGAARRPAERGLPCQRFRDAPLGSGALTVGRPGCQTCWRAC